MKPFQLVLLPMLVLTAFAPVSEIKHSSTSSFEIRMAPSQGLFGYLRCHRQAKNIVVNWGVTSTAGVSHFVVYHSEDNDFYTPLEEIPVGGLKYSFKHESVFPGYHYYYIAAVMNAAPAVNSVVDVVRIPAR